MRLGNEIGGSRLPINTFIYDKTRKRLLVNPVKKAVRTYFLQLDQETLTVPASDQRESAMAVTQDVHFEGFKLMGRTDQAGNPVLIRIRSTQLGWDLMNRPIHWETLVGTNLNPYAFATGLLVPGSQTLQVRFQNISSPAVDVNVQMAMEGRAYWWQKFDSGTARAEVAKMLKGMSHRRYFPFWLTTDRAITQTAVGVEEQFNISVPQAGDFEAWKLSFFSDAAFRWTLTDTFTGEHWHNRIGGSIVGLDNRISLGSNIFPMELEEPTVIGNNNRLILTVSSLALVGGTNRIFFTIGGRLITKEVPPSV